MELPLAEAALRKAIDPHLSYLHSVARRILGDEDLARDAVQEALVALWRAGTVPVHVRGWLVRTVVHRSLHSRRTRLRQLALESRAADEELAPCPLCEPERDLEAKRWMEALERELSALSAESREVFLLREREGLEYDVIARRMGIPIGTVRSRLSRVRTLLRDRLAAFGPTA